MMSKQRPLATSPVVVSLKDVSVTYPGSDHPTLKHCSLAVHQGQTILVTGPSGSGKSTLAMAIANLFPEIVEGTVKGVLEHSELVSLPGKIGYVFQNPEVQFCMRTVSDEIAFGLENRSIEREEMPARIRRAVEQVSLDVSPDATHATFSGGMKQKLAIASALALDCELLILDEPTANLDPASARLVFELIAQLRTAGKTMVIVEHRTKPLLPLVDHVVAITADGDMEGFYSVREWQTLAKERAALEEKERLAPSTMFTSMSSKEDLIPALTPCLEIQDGELRYGEQAVWHDVCLTLYPGEWVALVGPNGAGKSSLLEVLGGLRKPSRGTVSLASRRIGDFRAKDRYQRIAYGFQNPEYQFLFERVGDEMAGRLVGDEVPEDVLSSLNRYGLGEHVDESPYSLSQGQKRRLAVGVMLREPHDIYLFDEPTYGQDPHTEELILQQLRQVQAEGKCVVTITHDMAMVKRCATRVVVLAEGGIQFDGPVEELLKEREVLTRAHLLDDTLPLAEELREGSRSHAMEWQAFERAETNVDVNPKRGITDNRDGDRKKRLSPMAQMHPGVKFLVLLTLSVITLFANDFLHVAKVWAITLVVVFGLTWCHPLLLVKRLWSILALYVIYIWTFAANAAMPPGTRHIDWLWFHVSLYGLQVGVIISLRTFATVVIAYSFLASTDGTAFVVSLSQTFRVPPKLSYGVMAGTSFIPRFQHEFRTLRLARQVRGRRGWWLTRPVTYALPMLSQAIRLGERVAIAMEARGFFGRPAERSDGRTYYRKTPLRRWDVIGAILLFLVGVTAYWL